MGIKEEIFNEFIKKLESDTLVSDKIISNIKLLWEDKKIDSKENLLEAIKEGTKTKW